MVDQRRRRLLSGLIYSPTYRAEGVGSRSRAYASGNYRFAPILPDRSLFRQPRSRRRLREQNDPVVQQCLFYPGAGGSPIVFALPETYSPLINAQCGVKSALREASQDAGGAELAAFDKVLAVKSHNNLWCSSIPDRPPSTGPLSNLVEGRL